MAIDKSDYRRVFATAVMDAQQLLLDAKQHSNTLNEYLQHWQDAAEQAAQLENFALQDVLLLFVDTCGLVFKPGDEANLSAAQWQLLETWNSLFSDYIDAPEKQENALALIQCLNHPLLEMGLEPEDELMLLDSFTPIMEQLTANSRADISADTTSISPETEISSLTAETENNSTWQTLQNLFNQTDTNLNTAIEDYCADDQAALKRSLQQYLESWLAIAQQIETDAKQYGLLDVVLLFIEVTRLAFEQLNKLDQKQLELLSHWQRLFQSYLEQHGSQALAKLLIKCLGDPLWHGAIMPEDEKMLLEGFSAAEFAISSDESHLAADVITQSETATTTVVGDVHLNADVMDFILQLDEETRTLLPKAAQDWEVESEPAVMTEPETAKDNIEIVVDDSVLKNDVATAAFVDAIAESSSVADESPNITESEIDDDLSLSAVVEETVTTTEPEVIDDSVATFFTQQEEDNAPSSEDETLAILESAIDDEFNDEFNDVTLTIQDKKDAVWQDIEAVFEQAVNALKTAVDSEIVDDTAAFTQQINDYLECWQLIAETITVEDCLLPLADVILLFTELARQTFNTSHSLSSAQFALMTSWQTNVFDYFKNQTNDCFAVELVKCLTNPLWSEAITADDEKMLLEELGVDADYQSASQPSTEQRLEINESVEVIRNPVWQIFEIFFNDTQLQIQAMREMLILNNNQACIEYLHQYIGNWMVIAEIIAEEAKNLHTLADVTLLFADNCMEWIEQDIVITQEIIELLQQWHMAFIASLQDSRTTPLLPLIACLENNLWLRPLTDEDKEMLLELMTEENLQTPAAHEDHESQLLFNEVFNQNDDDEFAFFADDVEDDKSSLSLFGIEETVVEPSESEAKVENIAQDLPGFKKLEGLDVEATDYENIDNSFTDEIVSENGAEPDLSGFKNLTGLDVEETDYENIDNSFTDEIVSESYAEQEAGVDLAPSLDSEPDLPGFKKLEGLDVETTEPTSKATTAVNPELVGMVRDEFDILVDELHTEIAQAKNAVDFKTILKNHEFKFDSLSKACNTIGLLGLEQIFKQLSLNMRSRRDSDLFSEVEAELFKSTLPLIQDYITNIGERNKAVILVSHLSLPGWKRPFAEVDVEALLDLLSGLTLNAHNPQLDNRKTVAELADVSLLVPEDVNPDLLNSLLDELPVLTGKFSQAIQKIISGHGTVEQLHEAQRLAHTLKGSGNIVGVAGIAVVTHHLEEILEYLTEHQVFPTRALSAVLLESSDCLEMMGDFIFNGEKQPPEQALAVLQNVLDWANQITNQGLPAEETEIQTTTIPAHPSTDTTPIVQESKATEAVSMTRVPSDVIDKLLRMTGEGSILSEQFKERIHRFSQELKNLNELTWQMQTLVAELDQAINIQSYSAKSSRGGVSSEFDALEMEQYNELHTAASRISEVATDIREINIHMDEQLVDLKYLMVEEDTIQKENQEIVQSIRMVPANTIASRCQRIVRQACRATNKEVELEIKGADILIDSEILNDMVEPLMHLLRNSVDHGIEPVSIREKNNKSPIGKVTLEFSRKGNYAVISCKDDGGGLSSGSILQTAIKKGLVSAKQKLTDAEIHKLILIPGFSTRAVATQTSGRGIGMDAIQTKISMIQGQMSLYSVRGEGLSIEITIPLTLSSMLSLLVKCGGQTMAISNRGLRRIHHADECAVVEQDGHLYCEIEDGRYPAKYFAELVGMPISYSVAQKLQALRIEDEIGRTHIVFVEELLGYRDLLVKNMGSYIPHIQGITGASILGNGDVAPVIDLVEMLHHAAKYDYVIADASKALADNINGLPMALVVDDSLSARRSVAMLLKDSGIQVETAIDGLDAIKHIEKHIPDIILVDLEMPRMNGIEFTAHVRNREGMKNTPIIMITSRATEKHRKQAEAAGVSQFMTKPFTEDDLIYSVKMLMK